MKLSGTAGLSCMLVWLAGCGSGPTLVSVKGVVTRHGAPVKNLRVTFSPETGGRPSQGKKLTDAEGRFELWYDKDSKGAAIGKHKVTVKFMPPSPKDETAFYAGELKVHPDQDAITEKYGKGETTALSIEITHAESDLQIKLD